MPKNTATPTIVEIKLATLVKDFALAGRSEKEVKQNATELRPMMRGGWSPSQPGEFFIRDGKNHLAAGFTRTTAAEMEDLKTGYFVEINDDPASLRTVCIRTNASKSIKPFEQGRIYAAMAKGTDPETAEAGTAILSPMTLVQISEEVGKKPQWIGACIAIFESPEEIHDYIETGAIAANVVKRVGELVQRDPKKWTRAVKMIVKHAADEGKATATMKDLEVCRPDFAPLKAKAEKKSELTGNPASAEKPAESANALETDEKPAGEAPEHQTSPISGDNVNQDQASGRGIREEAQPELFGKPEKPTGAKKPAKIKDVHAAFLTLLNDWSEECAVSYTDSDRDRFVEMAEDAYAHLTAPF